jgi:hypothetical protein
MGFSCLDARALREEAMIALQSKCFKFQVVARRWHPAHDFGSLEAKVSRSGGLSGPGKS